MPVVGGLGRRLPDDFRHVAAFPLEAYPPTSPTPMVLGINWYTRFDVPTLDENGRYWIGRGSNLGVIRGGHAICVKPRVLVDNQAWWPFYNQGREGACVGFSLSRAMSLINRKKYDARWLYHEAQKHDEWPGEDYEGTSVRAGFERLRLVGHKMMSWDEPQQIEGIVSYRWANTVDGVHSTIKMPLADELGAVPLLNSWGEAYPRLVWLPDETLDRLFREGGEAGSPVDR